MRTVSFRECIILKLEGSRCFFHGVNLNLIHPSTPVSYRSRRLNSKKSVVILLMVQKSGEKTVDMENLPLGFIFLRWLAGFLPSTVASHDDPCTVMRQLIWLPLSHYRPMGFTIHVRWVSTLGFSGQAINSRGFPPWS